MRHALLLALVIAPVLAGGCKKKDPEPTPVVAAAAPALDWTWGPATFAGSRADGNKGTLTIPFSLKNASNKPLILQTVAINVFDGETLLFGSKAAVNAKAPQGSSASGSVEIPAEYKSIPLGDKIKAKVTYIYTLGTPDEKTEQATVQIPFSR